VGGSQKEEEMEFLEFLERIIDELEQEIKTNESENRKETDPLQRQSLEKIIDGDKALLLGLYDKIATSQSAPSKF
jgi:ClpP class serine protease